MIEPLRAANEIAESHTFAWSLISEDGAPVESSAALAFHPNCALTGRGIWKTRLPSVISVSRSGFHRAIWNGCSRCNWAKATSFTTAQNGWMRRGNAMLLNGADAELLTAKQVCREYPFLNFDNARFPIKGGLPQRRGRTVRHDAVA